MSRPIPIRFDSDTWIVMRTDPAVPKAVIQRLRDRKGVSQYLLVKWDLNPEKRQLMGVHSSLEAADAKVLWDTPKPEHPTGLQAFGTHGSRSPVP
jgi:hypothetical protein